MGTLSHGDPLAALVEMIATAVAEKLRTAPTGPTHYTIASPPPGITGRAMADAITRGELCAAKVGRRWIATAADVDAWIASRRSEAKPITPAVAAPTSLAGWTRKPGAR